VASASTAAEPAAFDGVDMLDEAQVDLDDDEDEMLQSSPLGAKWLSPASQGSDSDKIQRKDSRR
jgi:hypothetical protein